MNHVALEEFMVRRGGSVNPKNFENETFELLSIPAFDNGEPEITIGKNIGSSKKCVEPNDVLLSKIVPHIRRCWVVPSAGDLRQIASGEWIQFRGKKFTPEYLRYFLVSDPFHCLFMNTISGVGGSLLRASPSQVAKIKIPLPPLAEQKKIAAILDAADRLRQKDAQLIAKYNALSQSLFLDMFGDPVTNENHYEVSTLGDVTSKVTDGVHAKPEYTDKGIPFISVKDITTGTLNFEKCKFIAKEAHDKYFKRCNPELGDILYTKVGATYGRASIVDVNFPFSLYVSVALLKPIRDIVNPMYLKEAMVNPVIKRQADKAIKGIGVPDLHLNMIKKFNILLPPITLQNQFAERIQAIETQKQQAQAALQKSEDLFSSLLQRAFKGELTA